MLSVSLYGYINACPQFSAIMVENGTKIMVIWILTDKSYLSQEEGKAVTGVSLVPQPQPMHR